MTDIVEETHKAIEECRQIDKDYHYFTHISEELALAQAERLKKNPHGKLFGYFVSVKDNICVKDVPSQAGSAILDGYKPLFNATAVQRAIDEGAIIIGKTSQDEFGFGSFSTNTGKGFETPRNPFDIHRVTGGSSGGSGGMTRKASFRHVSIGESTGGSIAAPASFCGVVGLTPTYGRVSRNGLIDYANSLDKIGSMAKSCSDAGLLLEVMAGHDPNESTSLDAPVEKCSVTSGIEGMKIAVIKETIGEGVQDEVALLVRAAIKKLEGEGAQIHEISLPVINRYSVPAYYLLAMSEASTNLAKYCGMRYGAHAEPDNGFNSYFSKIRSHNLGDEAKRRIILGTFARMSGFRDAYYVKAMKARTKIIQEYKQAFRKYDALVSPTMPVVAPRISEVKKLTPMQNYLMDIMTVGPNLAGLPHVSVNAGFAGDMPVGVMLTSDHLQERKILSLGSVLG